MNKEKNTVQITNILAMVLALVVVIGIPLSYLIIGYNDLKGVLEADVAITARNISRYVSSNPVLWRYGTNKMEEYFYAPVKREAEILRILDMEGNAVQERSSNPPSPLLTRSHNIHDSGVVVGRLEISRSLRPLINNTISAGLLGLTFGMALFIVLHVFPLKDLKKKEAALRDSEEKYRMLFESASNAVMAFDADTLRFEDANTACLRLFGYVKEEFLALTPKDISAEAEKTEAAVKELISNISRDFHVPLRYLKKKDGAVFPGEIFAGVFFHRGRKKAITVIVDLTQRMFLEDELRKINQELEQKVEERTGQLLEAQEELSRKEKLAMLGRLSGSVGHELRNPLGVMNNAVYFLKTVLADADETTKEYLDMIKHEIENSQRIITDLLDFARTKPPQRERVAIPDLVGQTLGKCGIPDNVTVTLDLPEMQTVKADPLQMEQVLRNLITNAVQAMQNGGVLRIAARRRVPGSWFLVPGSNQESKAENQEPGTRNQEPGTRNQEPGTRNQEPGTRNQEPRTKNQEPDADFVEISVADTGEGISPENMNKLFQPLFTTKPRGIGLGLVVCRNLVEANGGRIGVESRVGEGTTFTVALPVEGEKTT